MFDIFFSSMLFDFVLKSSKIVNLFVDNPFD